VTKLRAAEARLRDSEERYRLAAQAAGCVIWDWDPQSGCTDRVGAIEARFGYRHDAVESTLEWWVDRLHPEDRERVIRSLQAAFEAAAEFWDAEYRFRRADGTYAYIHDRGFAMYGASGKPTRLIGAMLDITGRKEIEQELRRSEGHLARGQQIAAIGSYEYDPRSGELRWSDETYRLFGFTRENFIPSIAAVDAMLHPEDRGRTLNPANLVGEGPRPPLSSLSCEYRIIRSDGEVRVLQRECDLVFDAAGQIIRVVGTVQDVTDERLAEAKRLELEAQLLHAQKLESLGTLAGGIAHDLNNALTPIVALSKLVQATLPEASRSHRNLEIVRQAGMRARDLVKQILAFSRRETPKMELVQLSALVDDTLAMLRATIPATIRIDVSNEDVPPVIADPGQLQQVLVNLATNAAQAIGSGMGTIAVTLSGKAGGGDVCLSVTDTGCGMDDATCRRIFDPFFTTKPAGEGTGLGLAVVHGIVSSHGGRIDVTSAPGAGTRFEVHLPIAPRATPRHSPMRPTDASSIAAPQYRSSRA
jgi:PAS domain S-box-containing protein